VNLPLADHRHGMNGYFNLGCRCDTCREAATRHHRTRYSKIKVGKDSIDFPKEVAAAFRAYAGRKGESMRQIALRAVVEYMERYP
jgi:hypothetical protein